MRMRILVSGCAMRRPSSMADAGLTQRIDLIDGLPKILDPTRTFHHFHPMCPPENCHPR